MKTIIAKMLFLVAAAAAITIACTVYWKNGYCTFSWFPFFFLFNLLFLSASRKSIFEGRHISIRNGDGEFPSNRITRFGMNFSLRTRFPQVLFRNIVTFRVAEFATVCICKMAYTILHINRSTRGFFSLNLYFSI